MSTASPQGRISASDIRNASFQVVEHGYDKPSVQPVPAPTPTATGYTSPIQEIEYVRTYTKVAQVQLRAVIDALAEQVDRLGDLPVASDE